MDKKSLMKYVSSFVMGDGSVYLSGNGRVPVFSGGHIKPHKDYVDWKVGILSELTKVHTYERIYKNSTHPFIEIKTRSHPLYGKVRERCYIENHKVIDPHYLKLLDWEMLAIIYQDDGYVQKREEQRTPSVLVATDTFSYGDQVLIKRAIEGKLGVYFNIVRMNNKYRIRLRGKDVSKFMDGISPYLFDSFGYKCIYPDEKPLC